MMSLIPYYMFVDAFLLALVGLFFPTKHPVWVKVAIVILIAAGIFGIGFYCYDVVKG